MLQQRKDAAAERIFRKGIRSTLLSYGSSHPARISKKPWRWGAQRMVGTFARDLGEFLYISSNKFFISGVPTDLSGSSDHQSARIADIMNKHILNKTKGKSLRIHSDNDFLFGIEYQVLVFIPRLC